VNSELDLVLILIGLGVAVIAEIDIVHHRRSQGKEQKAMAMFAPRPMEPQHECTTCRYSQPSYGSLLCTHGSMARRAGENRMRRGLCGPLGVMWQKKEVPHAQP